MDIILANNATTNGTSNHVLDIVSTTMSWCTAMSWCFSFYPQAYTNWKRKSVVGLSFDFVAFDFVGFIAYSVYVIGLMWIPTIEEEYKAKYPGIAKPIGLSDIVFSLHGVVLTTIFIVQCLSYERGGQKVSEWTRVTMAIIGFLTLSFSIVATTSPGQTSSAWDWIDVIYALSAIKLIATVFKYVPQLLLNYHRKSTVGWNVYNVILDFTGAWISLVQIFVYQGYINKSSLNGKYWAKDFEQVAKYWLCVISLVFNALFLVQHYALYGRKQPMYVRVRSGEVEAIMYTSIGNIAAGRIVRSDILAGFSENVNGAANGASTGEDRASDSGRGSVNAEGETERVVIANTPMLINDRLAASRGSVVPATADNDGTEVIAQAEEEDEDETSRLLPAGSPDSMTSLERCMQFQRLGVSCKDCRHCGM